MLTDIRLAMRRIRRAPGVASIAVLTLALAIGANTAILGIADAVLFRPPCYGDADRLHTIRMQDPATGQTCFYVPPELLDTIERQHAGLGRIGFVEAGALIVPTPDGAASVPTAAVSAGYFAILEVAPHRSR